MYGTRLRPPIFNLVSVKKNDKRDNLNTLQAVQNTR